VNVGAPWPTLQEAEARVLRMQTKLHQWARDDPARRFDDLFNLVHDPATLVVAWCRVRGNKGKRSGGIDCIAPVDVADAAELLADLRENVKAGVFVPLPARERMIPKSGGKLRRLGIATVRDRVAQAALKLVLEPIFEAEFHPCSYGFRPKRRAQDAIAEIHQFSSRKYEWVLEGDIEACFDNIDHTALMGRVRRRVGDKRVLALLKSFLKAGVLGEDGFLRNTSTGTPQGGILTPPTQLAIRPCFALRVGVGAAGGPIAGVAADGDGMPDGDFVGADEDVFDEQPQNPSAFGDACSGDLVTQAGEEVFEVVGELEVDLPVGELRVEGVELVVQARLAGTQFGHPVAQFI